MLQRFRLSRAFFVSTNDNGCWAAEWGLADAEWSSLYDGDPGVMWWLKGELDLAEVHVEEGTSFSVKTNSLGIRDGLMPVASPWVLAMGCSTTFGWGVEADQAWPAVLEKELGVPVVNGDRAQHRSGARCCVQAPYPQARCGDPRLGLRDAQRTTIADTERRPAAFPRNTALYKFFGGSCSRPWSPRDDTAGI